MLNGVIILNKPPGPTSHDMVAHIRRLIWDKAQPTKVGHTGTLDPLAAGVLIITIGQATRLGEYTSSFPKTYVTDIILGATSTTDDRDGEITKYPNVNNAPPTAEQLRHNVAAFQGISQQVPPMYAARKVRGKKLYEYARAGEVVERQATPIEISKINLVSYEYPHAKIELTCSSGTYVRSVVRDLGDKLGVGAYVDQLQRTAIGPFTVDNAVSPDLLTPANITEYLQPPLTLVAHLPQAIFNTEQEIALRQGKTIATNLPSPIGQPIALLNDKSQLFGIGTIQPPDNFLHPTKILPQ